MLRLLDAGSNAEMGELQALGKVVVLAAIMTFVYFIYVRRAFGKTGATIMAVLVFFLLVVTMVCYRVL